MGASEGGGPDQNLGEDGDMGMAPVDLDQAMGSFSPEWDNDTVSERFFSLRSSESGICTYFIPGTQFPPPAAAARSSLLPPIVATPNSRRWFR